LKRFNFGDEEEDEEDYEDDEKFIQGPDFFSMAQFPMENENLVGSAIKICESSFFWKFYNIDKKINLIKKTYNFLEKLVEGTEEI
jgi:hypothetical protein